MASNLKFRERGIPKPIKNRLTLLLIIFAAAFVFFQIILNQNLSQTSVSMEDATLPVVSVTSYNQTMAKLHGYTKEMDALYMRDALIPLDDNRVMALSVETYDFAVDSASYELRSLDNERNIAETTIDDLQISDSTITASIQVENLVEAGEEYLFILQLHSEEQTIYYYTRIVYPSNEYISDLLDFAEDFHNTAMSSNYEDLASYVETSEYADTDTLSDVTIESSLDQIGWVGFDGSVVGAPLVSITDISDDYISITYTYLMNDAAGSYYNVEEYFRLHYTASQIYLLDYSRTMDEILGEGPTEVTDNTYTLGITPSDKEYLSNENGTIVAFVQAGELYEYSQSKQTTTKIFSFIDDPTDERQNYNQHNIRILTIDETGTIDFVVYGYMNRGSHEGECGIDLYHYDTSTGEAVEQVFISSTQSYEILNANFSNLLYESLSGDFYILLGGTLAKVGFDDSSTTELLNGLNSDQYAVSDSGQYVAWITEDEMADAISVMDLETEEISTITADSGTLIRPLAFMGSDLVYGIARESDITTDTAGSIIYPMYAVQIVDATSSDFTVLKSYEKSGYYVISVEKEDTMLLLERVTKDGTTYVSATSDTIQETSGDQNTAVTYTSVADSVKGSIKEFIMTGDDEETTSVSFATATLAVAGNTKEMSVSVSDANTTYFVYVGNHVVLTTQNLTKAIATADEQLGLVIDNNQYAIWNRGKASYVNTFQDVEASTTDAAASSSAGCLNALLSREGATVEVASLLSQGLTPMEILERSLDDAIVLDLSGCTLSEVLYYVSQNNCVYASTGTNDAVLIIGYNASQIVVYYSDTDTYSAITMDDAETLFDENNNVFISYIDK